jgi:hypothetical protein
VQLQDLRVSEAVDGVGLAKLQGKRAQIQEEEYAYWIKVGQNKFDIRKRQRGGKM